MDSSWEGLYHTASISYHEEIYADSLIGRRRDYRMAPESRFPEASADVAAAIRWVKAHAAEYDVNAAKIAIIGESAGGFLVNCAALLHFVQAVERRPYWMQH